jgi:hypothetical protein
VRPQVFSLSQFIVSLVVANEGEGEHSFWLKAGSHMSCDKERRVRLHREGGPKVRLISKDLR